MSGRGTGDEYTPHPGDPWHPDWAAEKEAADDDFVVETAAEDVVEAEPKRGLFGRRRKRAEADAESVTVEEFDEFDEVDVEGESSVDAYEALRDAEVDDGSEPADVDEAVRAAGISGIDLSIAAVAEEVVEETVAETFEPEAEELAEEPAVEVAETFEPEEAVVEEPAVEVAETFEPEAVAEEPAVEVAETFEPEAEELAEEPAVEVAETFEPEAVVEELAEEPAVEVAETFEPEEAVVEEAEVVVEEAEAEAEAAAAAEAEAVVEELAEEPAVEVAETFEPEAAVEEEEAAEPEEPSTVEPLVVETIPDSVQISAVESLLEADLPVADTVESAVPEDAEVAESVLEADFDQPLLEEADETEVEAAEEEGPGSKMFGGAALETAGTAVGSAEAPGATEPAPQEVVDEAVPKVGWWRRTFGGSTTEIEEPADPMAGVVEEASDIETWPEYQEGQDEDRQDVVSDTEFETVAEPEMSDLAVDEVAEPKRGWWRRGKQEDLEAESTISEALDRSEGELGTEGPAVSAAAAGMLDPEAETVEVDDETEVDADVEAVAADLGEAVDLEADVDEDADVAGIGFFGRLFGRSSEDESVAIDETVDDAISDTPVAPDPETDGDHVDDGDEWVAYTGVQADTEGVDAAELAEVVEPKLTRRQRRKAEKAAAALAAGAAVDGVPESAMEPDTDVDEWVAYAGIETEEVEEAQPADVAEPEPKLTRRQRRKAEKAAAALAAAEEAAQAEDAEEETEPGAAVGVSGGEGEPFLEEGPGGRDALTQEQYVSASTQEHVGLAAAVAAETGEDDEVQAVAASMPGVESGVVGFGDVVDSSETDEAEAARQLDQRDLAVRALTGVALAALFLGAVLWGPWAVGVLLVLVMLIALSEFYGVLLRNDHQPLAIFGIVGGFIALVGTAVSGAVAIPGALIITSIVMFFFYALEPERNAPLTNSALTLMGMAWVTGFSALAMTILESPDFRVLVLAVVALTVFMDTASYFSGRSWGRHKLAPELSPNKTVEGLIGGVVVVLLTGAFVGTVEPFDLQAGLALGAVVAIAAPLGDLAMSVFKRTLGVKDMGVILPGHGGILDRIDALLFVIPAAWATFHALGYLA